MRLIYLLALLALASIQSVNAQFDFPECYPGQTLFNSTTVTSDYVTGYPLVCTNGTFAPICNGVSVGYVGTLILCSQFNTTSGYVGTPPNVTLAPLNEDDISYTVTGLNCDFVVGCSDPMFSVEDCTNGYLSFTCPFSICDGPEISLYNNMTTYTNGTEIVTGILGICENGGLVGFCDDGSIFDGAAQLFCNGLGYLNGEKVASNSRLPLGANYLTNFTCISTPYGPSNCTDGTLATNPACYNGSLDYTIRCSVRRASCDGNGVTLNYNTTSIVNGTEYITGLPTQCNDGYIDALCNDGSLTQDTMDFLCLSIGYSSGELLMVNSTQYGTLPQGTAYYSNFTCPPNALSVDDCGAVLVQCPSAGSSMEYVLQCSRPYSVCEEGAVRFIDGTSGSYDSYDNTRIETLSGSLQICVDGEYRYVCGLSNASFSASDIVAAACIQLGYVNSSSNYTNEYSYQSSNPVIESISCPYNGSHFSLCSINTTTDSNSCYDYDRVLGGTCNRITPACTGLFQMADRGTFSYVNNTYVRTGRIEACVNNVYYPVCANGLNNTLSSPPTNYQLDGVCNNVFYSGYTYLPDQYIGSRSDYYNSTGSTRVISSISCPNGAYRATECNVTFSDNGCSSYGNDAVISCINRAEESFECSGNTITLANYTSYRSPYGSRYSIGRVVACINGSFVTVCNNTAYPEYFARLACDYAVSYSNYTIIPFDPMYLNGDYNVIVNNCSNTPQYSGDYSYCDNTVTNGVCSDGVPLTVRCEAECSSDGQVRLTDTDTVYYNNGTSGTTGNVEYCYNGRWRGICQNNLNDSHARVFCGAFGYNNGSFILSNSSNFNSYVNLSCPDYYFYSPSSCYVQNSFSMCNETSINALLYCYDASPDYCYSNTVRFGSTNSGSSYSSGQFPNVTTYSVGNVEICVNNTYYDVCADQLTPEQALFLCRSVSYDSNRAYTSAVIGPADEVYSYDASADSISNFTCPYGDFESYCSYDIVYNSGCTNNGGVAVITCIRDAPTPTCNTGSLQLQDRGQGYFNNGTSFSIGRPSICYNNSYIPYCTSFDRNTARAFCGISDNAFSARSYPIFGSTDDYGYNDQSSLIVSNLTCPLTNSSNYYYIFSSCDNSTSTSDNGGCSGISDEAVISCINSPVPCTFQTDLRYIDYISNDNSYTDIYQVGVCINSAYGDVCSDGITDDVALLFCHSRGGYYDSASVSYSYTNRTYSNYANDYAGFNCPYYADSLSSCYNNVSVVNDCSMGYGGILVIECTQVYTPTGPTSGCNYNGQVILNNTEYSTNNNSLYSISGYVSVCVNGTPALVCGDASIGQTELTSICYQTANLLYGYVGTPPGVTLAPLNVSDNTSVVDDYSCDPETIFSCTSTPGSTCSSGYLTVTCPQLCNGPSQQLYNNVSYTSDGIEYVTGIPIECENFVIGALCNDGSIYDDPASLFCDALGYENGTSINVDQASYGTLPEGTYFYNNYTCPSDAEHYDNCTANFTTNPNCANSSYNYVIQCYRTQLNFSTTPAPSATTSVSTGVSTLVIEPSTTSASTEAFTSTIEPSTTSASTEAFTSTIEPSTTSVSTEAFTSTIEPSTTSASTEAFTSTIEPSTTSVSTEAFTSTIEPSTTSASTEAFTSTTSYSFSSSVSISASSFSVSPTPSSTPVCTRLFQMADRGTFSYANNTYVATGRIEACVNGVYYPVCANGLNNTLSSPPTNYQLDGVCNDIFYSEYTYLPDQYIGSRSDYYNSTGSTRVISSISCPNGAYRATDCNVTFSDNGCSSYGNDAVISCIDRAEESFECSGNTIALANYTSYRSPYGSRYSIGRVVACINGSFVTVCNNTVYPEYFARLACNRIDSYLNYTIIPFDPIYLNGDYNVVFNNCSYTPQYSGDYSYCDDTVSNGVCSNGAPLTVRCEAECSTFGQVRLTDTVTAYYNNGTSGTTGNVEFCNSGTWNGVCQNDLNNSDANIFCQRFGYNNGSFISGGTGSSSSYINITCPNYNYYSPQSCSVNGDPFTMCNDPSTLYCYEAAAADDRCYSGQVQIGNNYYSTQYSYGQYPNFTSYSVGNVEICVNNTYYDVCADQLTPEQALFLCRSAGFNSDRAYTSAVIGPADEVYSYDASPDSITSFTCPYGYFDSSCTYNFVYDNGCTNNGGRAVVSCVRDVDATCNTGSLQLQDRGTGYFNNGTSFSIGRPSICYNNSYIPYCTSFDMNTARAFCGRSEFYYGARSYPIFGSTDDYGYNDQSSLIVSDLTCPAVDRSNYNYIYSSCYNTTSTSDNGGCSGISDETVISCINSPVPCTFQTNSRYINSIYTGDSYTDILQIAVCINSTYGDVCSDGITDDVALLFCRSQGGYYSRASVSYSYTNSTYSYYDNDYAGFNCPYYADSLSSCYDNVSVVNNCSMGYGGILVIECTQVYAPPTSCYYDGQVIFNNTENSTDDNSLYSTSGYVSVCVNGTPALVCGDASIGQTELTSICYQTASLPYGYVGTPPGVTLAPLNVSDNTTVVNNFSCDPETIFSCTSTPGSNCSSGYLTVTCPQLCNGPSLQLYNYQFYLSNGIEYVTGIPIMCENFAIRALCNDGSIYDDPASLLCDALGYENGMSINNNQASYGTLPEGTQYFNNFTCPPDAEHFDNCSVNSSTNPNCARSSYNYVIQCSRQAQIFGTINVTALAQSIEEGNTLTLTCSLMSNYPGPLPFSWFRGSNLITPSGRATISTSNPTANNSTGLYAITSQLTIQNTLTSDSGQYLCRVVPSLSDDIAITIRLRNECIINDASTPCVNGYCIDEVNDYYCVCPDNFIGKNCEIPVSSNSAPVIVTPPMDQDVPLSSLVNLTCVATGAPQPVITWYFEGVLITGANSPIYIIDSIQPAQRGTYSCRVMNSEGMDQATATVTINDIRQYSTVLTASRRKRQTQLPLAIEAVYNQTRDALVGNELSPGSGIIVADITYAFTPGVSGILFIFTLRVPPMANTNGVTNSLNGVTANIAANNPGVSFTPVMRFDGCSPETLPVTAGSSLSIMWPEVGIGVVARPNCPCGNLTTNYGALAMRRCNGTFSAPGVWLAPNTTQCIFDQTTTTLCQLSTNDNSQDVATQLNVITTNTEEIDPVDIGVIGTLAENLAEDASNPQVLGPLMDMMDNILDVPSSVFMESQQSSNGSQRFINTVETITSTLTITSGDSATVIRSKLAVRAQMVDSSSFSGTQLSVSTTSTGTLNNNSLSSSTNANSDASISLPSTLLTTAGVTGPARLGFSVIANGKLFQDTGVTVSTIVMSVDVYNNGGSRVPVQGLSDPVMVSFTVTSSSIMSECAFWDSTSLTWSTAGVTTVRTTTGVTCMATHLSSFAVVQTGPVTTPTPTPTSVTTPTEPVVEEYSPEPILFIGLIISILLILVAVIGHLASDAQRHCPEGRLLATSHITLIILYLVFVLATAATYTDSTGFCGTFAGLFHYFSLVYFVWLMFEGLFYAVKLRMGIGGNVFTRHFFIVSLIIALVLPAVIVIISAAAGYDYYTVENAFCRPQMHPFYYGYILPMIVIYLLALLNYIISFFLIYCSGMTSAEKQFRKDSVISHYYVGLILFIIFGVVWVFAITGTQYNITGPGSTALQYVFGFFSMIHALLLVILTFARTSDTRLAFRPVTRMIPGRKGQYDFASDPSVGKATRRETYGLDSSGKYLTNETETATTAEKQPLASGDVEDEPRYVTTTMTEKEPEASTVVANEEAITAEEEDKKTEL